MDRYKTIRKIGSGSFGTAQLATSKSNGEEVVVKMIDLSSMSDDEKRSAKREASILGALHHPCVLSHIETFEDSGFLCIITEYCANGDLGALVESRKGRLMKEGFILDIFVQISLAMLYCHKKRVLHRDLKLGNIFLTHEGLVKLGDFGIARVLKNTLELARTQVGTPYYLSPEICEGKPYSHRSDVWSSGILLYELCCQKHAFEADSITALCRKILKGTYEDIPSVYSSDMRLLISSMLQQKQGARPPFQDILKLSFMQPYLLSYIKKCEGKGITVPYIDQLIDKRVPQQILPIVSSVTNSTGGDLIKAPHQSSSLGSAAPLRSTPEVIIQRPALIAPHLRGAAVRVSSPGASRLPTPPTSSRRSSQDVPSQRLLQRTPAPIVSTTKESSTPSYTSKYLIPQQQMRSVSDKSEKSVDKSYVEEQSKLKQPLRRPSSTSSRSSDVTTGDDLLEEADALLPHKLPIAAYKVYTNTPLNIPSAMRLAGQKEGDKLVLSMVPKHRRLPGVTSGDSNESKFDCLGSPTPEAQKFVLDGETLNPAGSVSKDPLTYRIECLRVFLDSVLGPKEFIALYRRIVEARTIDGNEELSKTVRRALSKDKQGLLPLVYQLIWSEALIYEPFH
jgi:NIMA (never in mitosis gene a)-related kinase 1/4/5